MDDDDDDTKLCFLGEDTEGSFKVQFDTIH